MQFIKKTAPLAGIVLLSLASLASAQEQLVKIGHSGPLSGAQAFSGKDNENGARLAVEELNAKPITVGGKKLKFELISEDDQADPRAGVNVAQKLIDAGVKFVVGPYNSGVAIPASRAYNEANVVMATVGTNPKVTQGGYKNVFRIVASDSQIGSKMAIYGAKELKLKRVGVIDDRTAYGQGIADEFFKQARLSGIEIVSREFTTDKATDFATILTSLKARNIDGIFFGGYAPQGAPMARQMKQLGVNAKLLGGDTLCSPEMGHLGGDAVGENVLCAQGGTILDKLANGPTFKTTYKKRFNQDPDVYAAAFHDAVLMMADAMQKSGGTDPLKVAAEMHKMTYKALSGTYSFDENGNMKQAPVTVFTFKNGLPAPLVSY